MFTVSQIHICLFVLFTDCPTNSLSCSAGGIVTACRDEGVKYVKDADSKKCLGKIHRCKDLFLSVIICICIGQHTCCAAVCKIVCYVSYTVELRLHVLM